jgi:hypothetical protein
MAELTQEQINAMFKSDSRDGLGLRDPEIARRMTLRMGGTEEEADQVARFWEEENRKNGYALDKAS